MITSVVPRLPFIHKQNTLDFYVARLGFTPGSDYGNYFIIQADAAELHFFEYLELDPKKSDFMIYVRIDKDIDALYEKYRTTLPPFEKLGRLEQKPWGQKEFPLIDPNGTLLTFGQAVR